MFRLSPLVADDLSLFAPSFSTALHRFRLDESKKIGPGGRRDRAPRQKRKQPIPFRPFLRLIAIVYSTRREDANWTIDRASKKKRIYTTCVYTGRKDPTCHSLELVHHLRLFSAELWGKLWARSSKNCDITNFGEKDFLLSAEDRERERERE